MTANQINYAKYLEDVRTHKKSEAVAERQAAAAERQASSSEKQAAVAEANAVTNRMNAETNQQNALINESAVGAQWYGAQANAAYQQAMSAVSQAQQKETARHNQRAEATDLLVSGRQTTYDYYKLQKDIEQKEKERTKDYVLGFANILGTVGTNVLKSVAPILIGG